MSQRYSNHISISRNSFYFIFNQIGPANLPRFVGGGQGMTKERDTHDSSR